MTGRTDLIAEGGPALGDRPGRPAGAGRRGVVGGLAFGLAAPAVLSSLAAAPASAQGPAPAARSAAPVNTRRLPRGGEEVPVIGLGTFLTFDLAPGQPRGHLRDVLRTYWHGGARVVDTSPLYGMAEHSVGAFLSELGATDGAFLSNKVWSTGEFVNDDSHAWRSLQQSQGRLWRARMDVMHCHSLTNVDAVVPLLQAWKREGHVRFVGASHHENMYQPALAAWMERGALDFVQVNYSIFNRAAEERVLRVAADRGIGVLVNMPLEKARLHRVVEGVPLPGFAREFGAENWAQFFLKWVVSHPAVTCALPSTSDPAHARENVGALTGPLPDPDMRARMVRHMEGIPGFADIAEMPWYPGKRYDGPIRNAQAAVRARG